MLANSGPLPEFSIGQARGIVKDLFDPNPAVYWADFLLSMLVGAACFLTVQTGLPIQWLGRAIGNDGPMLRWSLVAASFVISCLALYRAALFTHELVHIRDGALPGFRVAWNLICGIPFFMPSFLYQVHVYHHIRKHYATPRDGEYLTLASGPPYRILGYLSQSFVIPLLAVVRFALLTPLTWLNSGLRDLVFRHASSMICDPAWVRPLPTLRERRLWRLQEFGCFVIALEVAALLYFGILPWTWLVQVYLTGATIIMVNAVRTIGAHRYRLSGEEVSFVEQLLDSVNYPDHPLRSELWAPVGLRFHALHHLFPSMPYHNLGRAHRRLMAQLPADSPYRRTVSPGLWTTIRTLWHEAKANGKQPPVERRTAVAA
jgi:fatty acid desaturase